MELMSAPAKEKLALRIPEGDRDKFAVLIATDPSSLDVLYNVLRERDPRLRVSDLIADIQPHVPIPGPRLRDIISLLLTLSWIRADQQYDAETLVSQLFLAAEESADDRLKIPPEKRTALRERLQRLVSLEKPLGVTSKALFVAYQFPRHYHDARVFTDTRPIFTTDPASEPAAFIVNHTLQLKIHDDGEDREWFLSMNTSDLRELSTVLDRALKKEASLRAIMEKTGVPVFDWEDGEEYGD